MNLGLPEVVLILIVFVLIFGTSRLPELGKGMAEGIKNFKKSMREDGENEKKKT
jgi:sec-independent protein translocase protein TatA